MKTLRSIVLSVALALICSSSYAYTMTFDDVPAGLNFDDYYFYQYRINFGEFFLSDHSSSSWGTPNSGSKVLVGGDGGWSKFNIKGKTSPQYMSSVSAYFSTNLNAVVSMEFYQNMLDDSPIATIDIGATGGSWNNQYISYNSLIPFAKVVFFPVNSNALPNFSMDDLTIVPTPVPEPSSVVALGVGLLPLGITLAQRKRKS